MTQSNLGLACSALPLGDRLANLERAIACQMAALDVFTPEYPSERAQVQANLGLAYVELPTGDRTANLERAVACYEEALQYFTLARYPRRYAILHSNLGNVYREMPGPNRSRYLQMAISHYQQALWGATRKRSPSDYAMIQNGLGIAYSTLPDDDQTADPVQAIRCFRKALTVYRRDVAPYDHAIVQMNLGNAYRILPEGDRYANQRRAIACYRRALRELTLDADPYQYASIQNNLGNAWASLGNDSCPGSVARSADCYRRSLAVFTPAVYPSEHRMTASSLGQLHFARGEWQEAHDAFQSALEAEEQLRKSAATEMSRQSEASETGDVAVLDAYCLIRLGHSPDAVTRLEGARARALSEALSRDRAALAHARTEDCQAFADTARRVRELEAAVRSRRVASDESSWAAAFAQIADELRQRRAELDAVTSRIRQYLPDFMPEESGFQSVARTTEPDCPLVYLIATQHGALAIIVSTSLGHCCAVSNVRLDRFSGQIPFDPTSHSGAGTWASWEASLKPRLEQALPSLGPTLMEPLAEHLLAMGYKRCMVVPCGRLGLLPLHAAQLADGRYLDSVLEVCYALSAQSLALAKRETGSPASMSLLGVVDPPHSLRIELDGISMLLPQHRLAFARAEVDRIAAQFPAAMSELLYGNQATRRAVLTRISTPSHIHFACHAWFDPSEPLASALGLSGEETLTVADLLNQPNPLNARLAVLAACDTARYHSESMPDEVVGFPAAFGQAGIPCVVSALWPVDDAAASPLLLRFYQYHISGGLPAATALHKARLWLRESTAEELELAEWYDQAYRETGSNWALRRTAYHRAHPMQKPFAHPYYWAAFIVTGREH